MKLPKIENIGIIGILSAAALLFFYLILGFSAVIALLGISLFLILPTYLILDKFELEQDEKIVLSFFIGAGIFPSIAYWIGMIVSFKIAILITFAVLISMAFLLNNFKKLR